MITADALYSATFDPALNLARQSLYRFAALSLLDPKAGSWPQLKDLRKGTLAREAAALIRNQQQADPPELGLGERPLGDLDPGRVMDHLPESSQALNEKYESTFGLLVSNACPPYETEYINSKFTFQRSNALADVTGFYRAFGLQASDQHPERPDHVVLELEFMATLLSLERQAAASSNPDRATLASVCLDAQRRFLEEHLAWWAPAFARLLVHEAGGGFYEAVGMLLAALIPAERGMLDVGIVSQNCQQVVPSRLERPEACDGCHLMV